MAVVDRVRRVLFSGILLALFGGLLAGCASSSGSRLEPTPPADYTVVGKSRDGVTYSVQFILFGEAREIVYPLGDRRCYDSATVGEPLPEVSAAGPDYDPNWKPLPSATRTGSGPLTDEQLQSISQEARNRAAAPMKCR